MFLSAVDQGLLYASVNHNHDTEYVPLSGPGLADAINPVINTYFSTPTADIRDQSPWLVPTAI